MQLCESLSFLESDNMKTGKTLTELAVELERIQKNKRDYIVPTAKLTMTDDAKLNFVNGESKDYDLTDWSNTQVATYSDIPKQYFDRIKKENPKLLADSVNHGLKKAAESSDKEARLVRTIDGKIRGFLSSRYRTLDAHDLLENTLPTLIGHNFNVLSSEVTDKRLYLKTVTPKVEGEVKKGDVIQYGVMLSTSDVGAGSLRVEPFFYRLACLNGAVMETKFRKAHLGSNNFERHVQEVLTNETKQLNDRAFFATVRDYLESTMRPENFERELNKMREAADRKIENFDLEKVIELTMNEVGVKGETHKKGLLAALASGNEGAGLTQWGLMNSFSRYAQDESLDYDTSTDFERASGAVLELNKTQWQRIAVTA